MKVQNHAADDGLSAVLAHLKTLGQAAPAPKGGNGHAAADQQEVEPADATPAPEPVGGTPDAKKIAVVMDHIDFDSLLAAWSIARKGPRNVECEIVFVESGQRLEPEEAAAYVTIEYVDMGGGELDHNGKNMGFTSSFALVCEKYGLAQDPGMQVLLELSKKADNAVEIPWDSIYYHINASLYDRDFKKPGTNEIDRKKVVDYAFTSFDLNYRSTGARARSEREYEAFKKDGGIETLQNGLTIAVLVGKPHLRGPVFQDGVDFAVWTVPADKKKPEAGYYVQMAVGRKTNLDLAPLVALLRHYELDIRGNKRVSLLNGDCVGKHVLVPGWFLMDPQNGLHKLIVGGPRKHGLPLAERTKLSKPYLFGLLRMELAVMSYERTTTETPEIDSGETREEE